MKKILSIFIFALMLLSFAACGPHQGVSTAKYAENMTDKGYKLPYEYDDGYTAYLKLSDESKYKTMRTTVSGATVVHLTTTKSEAEIREFYDDYFKDLPKVKAKLETDESVGYYDEENREVVFNLNVWTVDGMTNYSIGASKCEDIENDPTWELDTRKETETKAADSTAEKEEKEENSDSEKSETKETEAAE